VNEPCPHCHTRAKHGERVSCCSGCGVLFTSGSAFDKHRRNLQCLAPESIGLVRRISKTDPNAVAWGLDGGNHWNRLNCPVCGSGEVGDCVCAKEDA
jgi:hypothetical protein